MRLALFISADRHFSVPIDRIVHIVARSTVVVLPMLKSCFSGVFLDEQEMIPLLKVESSSGIQQSFSLIIIYESDFGKVGIPAERVLRVVERNDGDFEPCTDEPTLLTGIEECFLYGGKRYPLLNVDVALSQI